MEIVYQRHRVAASYLAIDLVIFSVQHFDLVIILEANENSGSTACIQGS